MDVDTGGVRLDGPRGAVGRFGIPGRHVTIEGRRVVTWRPRARTPGLREKGYGHSPRRRPSGPAEPSASSMIRVRREILVQRAPDATWAFAVTDEPALRKLLHHGACPRLEAPGGLWAIASRKFCRSSSSAG